MYSAISQNKQRTVFLMIIMGSFTLLLASALLLASGLDSLPAFLFGSTFTFVYALVSYYLSDRISLLASGAKPVEKHESPELYRIVENLCIANGQPMPAIYIIEDDSPNAFATGRDPEHASVAFTTGLLNILTKQEIEGVAAHELSHIKNYDIRIMTIVVVLVGAIMLISDIFLRVSFQGDRKQAGLPLLLIGLALAIISPLLTQIIQLAVSREREFLADASGALLTRYPEGLASALQKISASPTKMRNANHATAHLFISSPFGAPSEKKHTWFQKLFATHPPVEERVRRLLSMGN